MFNRQPDQTPFIIASKIIAKATIKNQDGSARIMAVFQLSKESMFFFEFHAPSTRSPRRKWIYKNYYIANEARPYSADGKSQLSLTYFLESRHVTGWSVRYPSGKRMFTSMMDLVGNPFKNGINRIPNPGQSFRYASAITSGNFKRRY